MIEEGLVFCTGSGIEQEARLENKSGVTVQRRIIGSTFLLYGAYLLAIRVFDRGSHLPLQTEAFDKPLFSDTAFLGLNSLHLHEVSHHVLGGVFIYLFLFYSVFAGGP